MPNHNEIKGRIYINIWIIRSVQIQLAIGKTEAFGTL